MRVEVFAENVESRGNVFRVFSNDIEVGIGLDETTWRRSNGGWVEC